MPTKDLRVKEDNSLRSISPEQIIESIRKLYETARQNPDKQFKVAYRNTDRASLNGYTGLEMIDMFLKAGSIPTNIVFSKEWVDTGRFNLSREGLEDFSYTEGYLPLWQEWARQNPELIDELRTKAKGKTLTDQFANTRVSQARALAEILNSQSGEVEATPDEALSSSFDTLRITSVEEQQKVDLLFDPKTRRDRVTLIARFFSNEVDNALQEMTDSLKGRINDASGVEREELQAELNSLDRFSVIKKYTPARIFKRVANIFNSYVQDTEEGRIQQELNKINAEENALIEAGEIDESERFSDEEKLEAAKKKAAYKNQEYKKIVDDPSVYKALAEEASTLLVMTEGIRIDPNYIAPALS